MKWLPVILLLSFTAVAQGKQSSVPRQAKESIPNSNVRIDKQHSDVSDILKKIEWGIKNGSVDEFEKELGIIVSIAIGSGERGYYSMNQAASMLSNYFSGRRPITFMFSRIHEKGSVPYATGRFVYVHKGNQESAQVYVSLTRQDSRWVINQFNIY
jgi:hypothetical protein